MPPNMLGKEVLACSFHIIIKLLAISNVSQFVFWMSRFSILLGLVHRQNRLKSTSVKKRIIQTPFLGGLTILVHYHSVDLKDTWYSRWPNFLKVESKYYLKLTLAISIFKGPSLNNIITFSRFLSPQQTFLGL